MIADLHVHTTFSDSSSDISDVIRIARDKELDAIAITDHDTVEHFTKIPSNVGVRVYAGIEISAIHHETKTKAHILGYGIQRPDAVAMLTLPLLEMRNSNSEKQLDILMRHGYSFETRHLLRAAGKYLYKQHIMDWLVKTGQVGEMYGSFYYETFKNGGICDFDIDYIDVFDAVKSIKEAGGQAVLAHPGQQQNYALISELAGVGLDGIELNHRSNSVEDMRTIRDYAKRFSLFLTGGSDYHGEFSSTPIDLGDIISDISGVNAVCGP